MDSKFLDLSVFTLSPEQWRALVPYLWLCFGIALSTVGVGLRFRTSVVRFLHVLALAPFVAVLLWTYREPTQALFGTSLEVDSVTRLVGAATAGIALLAGLFAGRGDKHNEWSPLMLISVLGMSLLPGARDWVAFFVALETLAMAGYVLTALDYHRESSLEAGLKYLFMGAFASSLLLMGITLAYGLVGSFDFSAFNAAFTNLKPEDYGLAVTAAFLIVASIGFKVAMAPFHMWAPDVYQAAPASSAAFLATATKVAVFGAAAIAFDRSGLWAIQGVREFVQVLAIVSILVGNLVAAAQRKVRRILAYSSVANAGYAGLALSLGAGAMGSLLTSLVIYSASVVAAFAMVDALCKIARGSTRTTYDIDVADLGQAAGAAPIAVSIVLAISFFSLAGIPPFPGFLGKYIVLYDVWAGGFRWGAVALILGTLLGLAYYLRLLVPLFMNRSEDAYGKVHKWPVSQVLVGMLSTLVLVGFLAGFSRLHQWIELAENLAVR